MSIHLKRIYDPASADDGYRVLVDRLWPRGVTKSDAALDEWCKELAPSAELRRWFGHDPDRWDEFRAAYRDELKACDADLLARLRTRADDDKGLTLLYAARDTEHNNAIVIKDYLENRT